MTSFTRRVVHLSGPRSAARSGRRDHLAAGRERLGLGIRSRRHVNHSLGDVPRGAQQLRVIGDRPDGQHAAGAAAARSAVNFVRERWHGTLAQKSKPTYSFAGGQPIRPRAANRHGAWPQLYRATTSRRRPRVSARCQMRAGSFSKTSTGRGQAMGRNARPGCRVARAGGRASSRCCRKDRPRWRSTWH